MSNRISVFGEVLFDIFPDGSRVLGGAPFNVAWHLQAFAQDPLFISRVGDDPEGMDIRNSMLEWGMDAAALGVDESLQTGRVNIKFDDGEPQYEIVEPAAYDAIVIPSACLEQSGFLYHGTLAIRGDANRQALEQLVGCDPGTVFVDVNLRPPWWDRESVIKMLYQADWVKLNADEFNLLYATDRGGKNILSSFIYEFGLQGVVLTHGKDGAEVMTVDSEHHAVTPESCVDVVDSVGAGDALSSVFIMGISNNWPLFTTLQRAQEFASAIVGERGATVSRRGFYTHFLNLWGEN